MNPELKHKIRMAKAEVVTEEIMKELYSPAQLEHNKMCKWRYSDVIKLVAAILVAAKVPVLED